ncbi:MAG: SBBP repeat-containing protein [Bryobacteraceae bacterium]|nr:SBBP repeat-containing protein [Bryobacteraceae bacterium]
MHFVFVALLLAGAATAGTHELSGPGWSAHLTLASRTLRFGQVSVGMEIAGARQTPSLSELPGRIRYSEIYDGIHLDFYRAGSELEYDFVVAPGADPSLIAMEFPGFALSIDERGELVMTTARGEVRHRAPVSYQSTGGRIHPVASRFRLRGKQVSFEIGSYDRAAPLVIDPVLTQRFVAGNPFEATFSVVRDSAGNSYFAGFSVPGHQSVLRKVSPTGTLLSATILPVDNGAPGSLSSVGEIHIAVDAAQNIYGGAQSKSCPANATTIIGAIQNPTAFLLIFKLHPDAATFSYLTCVRFDRNNSKINGITFDDAGNAYVVGTSDATIFPVTSTFGPILTGLNQGFLTKVNATGQSFPFSILFGSGTEATSVFRDVVGNLFVGGVTGPDFQTVSPLQAAYGGGATDGFLMKVRPDGLQVLNATFLGGAGADAVRAVTVDGSGQVNVGGETESAGFPILGPLSVACVSTDGFVARYNAALNGLSYSTCFPGSEQAKIRKLAQGLSAGVIYAAGQTFGGGLLAMKLDNSGTVLFSSVQPPLNPAGLFAVSGGFITGGTEGFPERPALWTFQERADLGVTVNSNSATITNSGPDGATGTVLTVSVVTGTIQTQDPRCGVSSAGRRLSCKVGNVGVGEVVVVNFTSTGAPTAVVQSQVFDPHVSNNQTRP